MVCERGRKQSHSTRWVAVLLFTALTDLAHTKSSNALKRQDVVLVSALALIRMHEAMIPWPAFSRSASCQ